MKRVVAEIGVLPSSHLSEEVQMADGRVRWLNKRTSARRRRNLAVVEKHTRQYIVNMGAL